MVYYLKIQNIEKEKAQLKDQSSNINTQISSLKNKIDKISEIRIEEVIDKENEEKYYWVYFVRNGKIEVIGKSCQKPQCYRQVAVYQ